MIANSFGSVLVYLVMSIGVAWPVAARLACSGPEKILVSISLSLLGVFLLAWAVYVWELPLSLLWVLPVASVATLVASRRSLQDAWRDRDVQELLIAQLLVTSWCIGWLALVVTYSGGSWVGDWFGHWQRVVFFMERGPRDILFNGFDPLTSRPPLANIVFGAFMALTRNDFSHYQLATTFFSSLAFVPAALFARRFGGRHAVCILAVMLMLSPLFVQNATYAWTKLPAAFFTLAALYFFLRARDGDFPRAGLLCAATLSAALLTHYSAGPYAVMFAVAWIGRGWARRREATWWRETALAVGVGAALLATWFGWSLTLYGAKGTFLTNPSVTDKAPTAGAQLWAAILNVRDTLVPHFLRDMDYGFIAQQSPWGWWRDWFFQLYQVNLFFAFGSIAWLVVAVVLWKSGRTVSSGVRVAWALTVTSTVILGIMVHGGRDGWGLAHICLQPLVLLGLALLAARWETLGAGWRWTIAAGASVDFALGIALHFGAQSFLLDRWLAPQQTPAQTLSSYSAHAAVNLRWKSQLKLTFFGDGFSAHDFAILTVLGLLLMLALLRARQRASPG